MTNTNFDVHSHVLPSELLSEFKNEVTELQQRYDVTVLGRKIGIVTKGYFDDRSRREEIKAWGVDSQVVSISHQLFMYNETNKSVVHELARKQNQAIAKFCKKNDDVFIGNGTLPLQDTHMALEELEHIYSQLGLKGVEIGTNIAGKSLDSEDLFPVFEKLQEYKMPVLVHPNDPLGPERLKKYYMEITVGTILETTVAISSLIFGKVLERFPRLKFIFCHGGGAIPYQIGRLERASEVRKEMQFTMPIREYFHKLYFDSVVFSEASLKFLLDIVGPDRLLFGTDYPFNLGDPYSCDKIRRLPIDSSFKSMIASNSRSLYNL